MAKAKRKKRFYKIDLPLIQKSTQLQAYEPKELNNKYIKYDLTRSLRGKSILLTLRLQVKDDQAKVLPKELKMMQYYLKRMVRKGTSYVEDSFSTECKDSQIRIKPFLITRKKVPRSVKKALREKAKKELIEVAKTTKLEEFYEKVLKSQIQKPLSLKLKKYILLPFVKLES